MPEDLYLITTPSTKSTIGQGGSWYTEDTILTINQMPSHTYTQNSRYYAGARWKNSSGLPISLSTYDEDTTGYTTGYSSARVSKTAFCTAAATATNKNTGGGKGNNHKFQPPYYQLWAWKRIA